MRRAEIWVYSTPNVEKCQDKGDIELNLLEHKTPLRKEPWAACFY